MNKRIEAKARGYINAAYKDLHAEFVKALMEQDPSRYVRTPWFSGVPIRPAYRVVRDDFDSVTGDDPLIELLKIIGALASGQADESLSDRAAEWIGGQAHRTAKFNCDDLAYEMAEAAESDSGDCPQCVGTGEGHGESACGSCRGSGCIPVADAQESDFGDFEEVRNSERFTL